MGKRQGDCVSYQPVAKGAKYCTHIHGTYKLVLVSNHFCWNIQVFITAMSFYSIINYLKLYYCTVSEHEDKFKEWRIWEKMLVSYIQNII